MELSYEDQVWNRACLQSGGPSPAEGDRALASLLLAHGLIMNGGVVHAMECLTHSQLAAARDGFEYFGLIKSSAALKETPDDSEETEERLNKMYRAAVPDDEALVHVFRAKLLASPEAFADLGSGHA